VFQIRIHGRGGQGVVTAAELLSVAAFLDGKHSQAFPSFGSERTGAPVVSFCRISTEKIRLREPIQEPDVILIQDPTLLHSVDVFAGAKHDGVLLINTKKTFTELGIDEFVKGKELSKNLIVPASEIAMKFIGRPLPNAALLGGLSAATGIVRIESVLNAIDERFPSKIAKANQDAATSSYEFVKYELEELVGKSHVKTN
jgi:pyruvate ferredoxin oxidoreductase gamma subunit